MKHVERPYHHHKTLGEWIAGPVNLCWPRVTGSCGPFCARIVVWIDDWWMHLACAVTLVTVAIVAWDVYLFRNNLGQLDWLWISGYPFGLFVLFRSTGLPDRILVLRHSLLRQGILEIYDPKTHPYPSLARERRLPSEDTQGVLLARELGHSVLPHTAVITILFCAVANYAVHSLGVYRQIPADAADIVAWNIHANHVLGHVFILLISFRLGRVSAFSILMWAHSIVRLRHTGTDGKERVFRVRLNPQPGHPDGICGLKSILDFWTFEASLLVPPTLYTLLWLGISSGSYCDTRLWNLCGGAETARAYTGTPFDVFLSLSLVLILLQFLSLWWPMLALRLHMGHTWHIVKDHLDEIVKETTELRHRIATSEDATERDAAAAKLAHALEAYSHYQEVKLWPIPLGTLKSHITQLWTVLVFLGITGDKLPVWGHIKRALLGD